MLLFFSIGHFHFIFQPEVYGHSLQWTILKPHMDPMDDCQVIYVTALAESTLGDLGAEFVVPLVLLHSSHHEKIIKLRIFSFKKSHWEK